MNQDAHTMPHYQTARQRLGTRKIVTAIDHALVLLSLMLIYSLLNFCFELIKVCGAGITSFKYARKRKMRYD